MDRIDKTISNGIDKKSILKTHTKNNYRTITEPKRIGELMRAIDMYKGDRATVQALKILPFVFVRPSNLRLMEWKELDFEANTWTIPADKMKMKKEHKLPLHPRVIELIKEIEPYTKNFKYVFPSPFKTNEPLSDNTFNLALKRLDFGGEIVAHGFRAMFSTVAYESGLFKGEVIEALMAHQDTNQIRRAYNRATYDESKKEVITWYGDFLEDVKQNKEVR
jgi:integrase